ERILLIDLIVHQRLEAGLPGAVESRRHDEEGHEQRQADEDEVGWRALQAEAGAQKRERDDEAGEARDHDEKAGRDRKHGQNRDQLDDPAAGRRAAGRNERVEIDRLSAGRRACRDEREACPDRSSHCTTKVRITNARTFPPLRVAARSFRSWRMFSSPIGPSSSCSEIVRKYARMSSPIWLATASGCG